MYNTRHEDFYFINIAVYNNIFIEPVTFNNPYITIFLYTPNILFNAFMTYMATDF